MLFVQCSLSGLIKNKSCMLTYFAITRIFRNFNNSKFGSSWENPQNYDFFKKTVLMTLINFSYNVASKVPNKTYY